MRTIEQWNYLARCSVRGVTNENAQAIAVLCFHDEMSGGQISIWHASTIVHRLPTCPCMQCREV